MTNLSARIVLLLAIGLLGGCGNNSKPNYSKEFIASSVSTRAAPAPTATTSAFTTQESVSIEILRHTPSNVLSQMPVEARSIAAGICKIGPKGESILLHLYALPIKNTALTNDPSAQRANIYLAFFEQVAQRKPRQLNIIDLYETQNRYATSSFISFPTIMWLNYRQRDTPVFICQVRRGGFGGNWLLFLFRKGLGQKPLTQKFTYSQNPSQMTNYSFDFIDERGFMIVSEEYSTPYGTNITTPLYWNGSRFAKTSQK